MYVFNIYFKVQEIQSELEAWCSYLSDTTGRKLAETPEEHYHPRVVKLIQRQQHLQESISKLEKLIAYRPDPVQFSKVSQAISSFMKNTCSHIKVTDLVSKLLLTCDTATSSSYVIEEHVWQDTTSRFIHQLQNTFHCYKDITGPFIQAIQTMKLGIRILAHKADRMVKLRKFGSQQSIKSAVENVCSFPTVTSTSPDLLHLACHLIKHVTSDLMCNLPQTDVIKSRLLVCALFLIRAHSFTSRCINSNVMTTLSNVLDNFTNAWTRQEEQKKLKEAQKSALFKYKDECHGDERSEREREEADFKAAYPTFELAFIDVTGADRLEDVGLENQAHHHVTSEVDPLEGITISEMVKVCSIHRDMMTSLSQAVWLDNDPCNTEQETDLMTSSFMLYQTGAEISKNVFELLGPESDQSIIGSHIIFANSVHQYLVNPNEKLEKKPSQKNYNIYYDSNVPEVIKCKPVLESLRKRVQELQVEWPDHPTLLLLNQIIDRIMSFSVSEPVMKFLTGLELVLLKAQDWESNAASFVSMSIQLGEISRLIIEWRKLELSCWSSSLDREEEKYKEKASHWWFHLYQLISSYLTNQQIEDGTLSLKDNLVTSLKTFIESSTVGEYDLRLHLLLTFHCHILLTKESPVQKQLLHLLWNVFQFYKQYQNQIKDEIKTMRGPIDKQLKGFVKIARWNDMNYWALKASTEKSHRTVHKFIKEYQAVLHQPVKALLGDKTDDLVNSELNITSGDSLETTVQVMTGNLKKTLTLDEPEIMSYLVPSSISGITLLPRLQSLFRKVKKHLLTCVEKPRLLKNVLILDEFIGELIEEIHLLQALQATVTSDKEKQKSEAHSINLRKRKRLADLFKCLADLGLSYRKGVGKNIRMALSEALDVPPFHVSSSSGLPVKSLWSGCEHYFYRCMSRHAQFTAAVISPSKELGMSEIERCRGFTEHFSQLYVDQRIRVTQLSQDCLTLRKCIEAIDTIKDSQCLPPQGQSSTFLARTKQLATQLYQGLSQTLVLLKACPSGTAESVYPSPLAKHKLSPSALWNQGDAEWQQCFDSVQVLLKKVTAEQNNIDKLTKKVLLGRQHMIALSQTVETFLSFTSQFDVISAQFSDSSGGSSCFTSSLNYLSCEVKQLKHDFIGWWDHLEFNTEPSLETVVVPGLSLRCGKVLSHLSQPEVHYGEKTVEFVQSLDSFVEDVLLCVQNVVNTARDVSHDDLQEAHLTKHLVEMEISLLNKLNLPKRISKLEELLRSLCCLTETTTPDDGSLPQSHSESASLCIKSFLHCQPLIKSLSVLIEGQLVQSVCLHRCMGKLLSVLLAVFTELSQKGFCLPPELSDEKGGEGATEFKDIEGGGLGEGEGAKDVSDQIESEDQLDGVKGLDKDEAEEQKNVPSEDNAIEMSDDFDGKVQDNEDNDKVDDEDDKSSQGGEEEEMDQQMGDVDEDNNDKLDDRLWGSDDEEDDNEAKDDERGGDGMDKKMEEMAAKDENKEKAKEQENKINVEENKNEEKDDYDDNQVNPHNVNEDRTEELDLPKDLQLEEEDNTLDREEENMETEQNPEDETVEETDENKCDEENRNDDENRNDEEIKNDEENNDNINETDEQVPSTNDTEEKEESEEEMTNSNMKAEEDKEEEEGDNLPDQEDKEKPTSEVKSEDTPKPADNDVAVDEQHGADEQAVESSSRQVDQTEVSDVNMEEEEESEGVGAASSDDPNGHKGPRSQQKGTDGQEKQSKQEKHVGQSDADRTLGNKEKEHRFLKTSKESRDQKDNVDNRENKSVEYEHIKDANSEADAQTVDAATTEQMLEKQAVPAQDKDGDQLEEDENVEVDNDDVEDVNMSDVSEKQPAKGKRKETSGDSDDENNGVEKESVHVDGEKVLTMSVERPPESTIHTNIEHLHLDSLHQEVDLNLLRSQLEENVHIWSHTDDPTGHLMQAAVEAWQKYYSLTSHLAQELCEQLRLILEPSKATKLKGDYRTGKRLNMRKVIPYIASQFRKDKIWLRRSKPSKRHYQIMIAVDDSASMGDTHSKQLAFESLALVSNALTLLESGELAVCSFGEEMRLLHPFSEPFTNESGARILHLMTCQQKQTKYGMLLDNAIHLIKKAANSVHSTALNVDTAQLLLILSDGQGVFREGMEFVRRAVRRARSARIFIVFVILDKKGSILDARVPIMDSTGKVQEIKSYLEMFPFPFYIILRDINSLPQILSDALRQWFELVTASDSII
ncbi:AAA ATPase midasin [Bulinus truncatus]|nr:AAA ATPase midasin [Bulinus truncatus]